MKGSDPVTIRAKAEMRRIPGGTAMLTERGQLDPEASLSPTLRPVTVDSFDLDVDLVTVERFASCIEAGGCKAKVPSAEVLTGCNWGVQGREKHPMNCVSAVGASEFCAWDGKRLPTDEEWEYAARGGAENRERPWGTRSTSVRGCWARMRDGLFTCAVGSYPETDGKWGLRDMVGNVLEWTSSPPKLPAVALPDGSPGSEAGRGIVRGHDYALQLPKSAGLCRLVFRADLGIGVVGFRCARTP